MCPHDQTQLIDTVLPGGDHPAKMCPACGTVYTAEALAKFAAPESVNS